MESPSPRADTAWPMARTDARSPFVGRMRSLGQGPEHSRPDRVRRGPDTGLERGRDARGERGVHLPAGYAAREPELDDPRLEPAGLDLPRHHQERAGQVEDHR